MTRPLQNSENKRPHRNSGPMKGIVVENKTTYDYVDTVYRRRDVFSLLLQVFMRLMTRHKAEKPQILVETSNSKKKLKEEKAPLRPSLSSCLQATGSQEHVKTTGKAWLGQTIRKQSNAIARLQATHEQAGNDARFMRRLKTPSHVRTGPGSAPP